MQPVWLIEAGVYDAEIDALLAEIRRQQMVVDVVPHQALTKDRGVTVEGRMISDKDCVIGYGTFPFARQIQLHRHWTPGAWATPDNLDCTTYFAYFGKYLLNQHYAIMPGVEAIRQRDRLFEVFGKEGEVFARPTGCHKLFIGRCIYRDDFITAMAPTRYDPTTLVVIASPREIKKEWRLVVVGDRVIAASQYSALGCKCVESGCPSQMQAFAESMLAEVRWRPDPIFMLDVCEAEGRPWLIEINGFSCSWLYACDLEAVVREAGKLASELWDRAAKADTRSPQSSA